MSGTELAVPVQAEPSALQTQELSVSDVLAQVNKIQQIMKSVMKDGEHYGKIPGCGDKPTLLKPGAEKIGFTFRIMPSFIVERLDLPGGHREYIVTCELRHVNTNSFVGSGVGSCSTMEAKYRFRTGPKEFTGQQVPKDYWDLRKTNPAAAQASIGGPGFSVGKNDSGVWEICIQGEKVEHDNPADYFNTVLKMAKKRAHVDAILTSTAASDIFTQDIEDLKDNGVIHDSQRQPQQAPVTPPQRASKGGNGHTNGSSDPVVELAHICDRIATAGMMVQTTDYKTFTLSQAPANMGTDMLRQHACTTLSSFQGRNGPVQGKSDPAQLSGTPLTITLGKARKIAEQLPPHSQEGSEAQESEAQQEPGSFESDDLPPAKFACQQCGMTYSVLPASGVCPGDGNKKCLGKIVAIAPAQA